ncbi:hypothetical protein [Microbacterium sp. E-13]|uniref:helix-turn-helix transcriptional regulator n=1 Tax=Microbacterium sp. E-13 TaxID=3404048 RepID=UPI003CEEA013
METQLDLFDAEAIRWLAERGWSVTASRSATLRLYVDELSTPRITIRRIWHTPMTLVFNGASSGAGAGAGLVLQVEGDAQLSIGQQATHVLRPYSTAVFPTSAQMRLISHKPTARVEVLTRVMHPGWLDKDMSRIVDREAAAPSWSVFTSLTNAVMNAAVDPSRTSFPMIEDALESAAFALLTDAQIGVSAAGSGGRLDELYEDACRLIRQQAGDVNFTVQNLADHLGVSRRYLSKSFAARGERPYRRLRDERVNLALRMLRQSSTTRIADSGKVAVLAGFPSHRAMREALRRAPDARQPGQTTYEDGSYG